jgi:hypothetical protein
MSVINFNFWKRFNRHIVIKRLGLPEKQIPQGPAKVFDFVEHRNSISEDKRWVRNYLWWSDMIHKAKKRKSAEMRANNNRGLGPRRR